MAKARKFGELLRQKLEATRWANTRFHALVAEGETPEDAQDIVLSEGQERFGADWVTLLPHPPVVYSHHVVFQQVVRSFAEIKGPSPFRNHGP